MSYLGSFVIDDFATFPVNTSNPTTGAAADATGSPAYRVYEDETATPILTGSMAKLDDANTTGFYTEQIQLTATNGFELGKIYTIYIEATVAGVLGATSHQLQMPIPSLGASVEPTGVPAWGADRLVMLDWLLAPFRNKITQSTVQQVIRNDADDADIATAQTDDTGSVFTVDKWT